jgi:DNA-binding LacI/PurR family transcriptional regulator
LSHDPDAEQRLARMIDESRLELGLSKHDLARIARVARPTVSRLINHAEIPARASTLARIEKALGWEVGACAALLNGQTQPGPSPVVSRSSQVVAQRLSEIADEAGSVADVLQRAAARMKGIEERARAAAQLALRTAPE